MSGFELLRDIVGGYEDCITCERCGSAEEVAKTQDECRRAREFIDKLEALSRRKRGVD